MLDERKECTEHDPNNGRGGEGRKALRPPIEMITSLVFPAQARIHQGH